MIKKLSMFLGIVAISAVVGAAPTSGPAPDFRLAARDGSQVSLTGLRGEVVMINFWATWCGPCRIEIPDLVALQEEFGSESFTVVGISTDLDEPEFVKQFANAMKINYPVLLDDGEISEAFGGVYALPTTFVVDKTGKITHRTIGLFPVEAVREELSEMISTD